MPRTRFVEVIDTDRPAAGKKASMEEEKPIRAPRSALFGTCFNLFNTILGGGGGIVPLPNAVRLTGLTWGPVLILLCAIMSAYSACAVITASCLVNERSYHGTARHTLGRAGAVCVQLLIVMLLFGISVAVVDIFADVAPALLHRSRTTCVLLAGAMVTPVVALVRRIERLAPISMAASVLVSLHKPGSSRLCGLHIA